MRNSPIPCLVALGVALLGFWHSLPAEVRDDSFFTIVVMPDTQYYTEIQRKTDTYFKGQTRWIVENRQKENIVFVCHVGDLQQDGNYLRLDRQPDPEMAQIVANADPANPPWNTRQWERADKAMRILDEADVPYVAVAGNHDFEHWGRIRNPVMYLKYFGPQRFEGKEWFGGYSPASSRQPAGINNYQFFEAGGYRFLSLGLRFAPDAEDLAWAQRIIDENPGLPVILTTHAYVIGGERRFDKDRRNIWEQLIRKNPRIFMTFNGHHSGRNLEIEKNDAGLEVYQMLVNYQHTPFEGYDNGGGYMWLVRFETGNDRVVVRSYSPVTREFLDVPRDNFTIEMNFIERLAAPVLAP